MLLEYPFNRKIHTLRGNLSQTKKKKKTILKSMSWGAPFSISYDGIPMKYCRIMM